MIEIASLIFVALFGYALGSIPFGLVLCKLAGLGDIREIGSGNIGATNVLRTGNKPLALATLLLDSGKGAIAVLIIASFATPPCSAYAHISCPIGACPSCGSLFSTAHMYLAGLFALVGHCYPIWLKFKGGKGVATTLGTLIALAPALGAITCMIWMATALFSRISSLSALVAVGLSPLIAHYLHGNSNLSFLCALIAALVYIKHRDNIKRLFAGQEPRIGKKK